MTSSMHSRHFNYPKSLRGRYSLCNMDEFGSDLGEIEEVEIVGYAGRLFHRIYSCQLAGINPRTAMTTSRLRFAFVFSSSRITMLYQVDVCSW